MAKPRGRLPSCPDCGVKIEDKKLSRKIGNRWVCLSCVEIRDQIETDRQELYELVAELFFMKFPTGMMMKQIKDYKEDLEYTYRGMTLSLIYWTETLGNTMSNARGVGIIPYIYEDAKNFYIEKMEIRQEVEGMGNNFTTRKEVKIQKSKTQKNKNGKYKVIDMNSL